MNQPVNQISADEKKRVLRRLKKVLALSESSNPGEAAAALHQADAMMKKYGVTSLDAEISSVEESESSLTSAEISKWETALFGVVAASLGVSAFISGYKKVTGLRRPRAKIIFVGEGYRAEVAVYAFETLRRKLRKDLKTSFDEILSHANVAEDARRFVKVSAQQRDAYAYSWCRAVRSKVEALAPPVPKSVTLYLESRLGPTECASTPAAAQKPKEAKPLDSLARYMASKGNSDGLAVEVHKAVHRERCDTKQIGCEIS